MHARHRVWVDHGIMGIPQSRFAACLWISFRSYLSCRGRTLNHVPNAGPFDHLNEFGLTVEMASFLRFFYEQLILTPSKADPEEINLQNQVGIVTGSNIGLGLEASRQLLGLGLSHLILAVRDRQKGNNARQDLARAAPQARIEVWDLDLSSYESVQLFVQNCSSLARLDLAILNAGTIASLVESKKGERLTSRLWQELLDELSFANVDEILGTVQT
ncbi:MAG: hypothetical protein Q9219_003800 [cf. Caloplaca sp. 3 TL-2023]